MDKYFANFKQSLNLKGLGFNEPCLSLYYQDGESSGFLGTIQIVNDTINSKLPEIIACTRPLKSQVFEWFRDNYDIHYSIDRECSQHDRKWGYNWSLYNWTGLIPEEYLTSHPNAPAGEWVYEKYEEAEYALIDKLIEIVIVKRNEK